MPSPRLSPTVARLLALQTLVTPVILLALLAFVLYNTRPNHMGMPGGVDTITSVLIWIAFIGVLGAISAINLIFSRQLRGEAKGERRGVKSW